VKAFEKNVIILALQKMGKVRAAKELGISRRTLMYRLQEYGLSMKASICIYSECLLGDLDAKGKNVAGCCGKW
jgi:hypothetical protein